MRRKIQLEAEFFLTKKFIVPMFDKQKQEPDREANA
jgi:hypothetical protein